MSLKLNKILVYYDSPQLFIAKDEVGTKFICLNVTQEDVEEKFIGVAISDEKLEQFIFGKIDLRSIYLSPQLSYYLIMKFESENILEVITTDNKKISENYLPEEGFYLEPPLEENRQILTEVNRKDKPIVHLSISNGRPSEGIEINLLGDILKLYQGVIKYSYRKSIAKKEKNERNILDIPNNYKLKAFANSHGSFKVHLESNSNTDLFKEHHILNAFRKIDDLLIDGEENIIINKLRENKGHTVNSLKNLFEIIIDGKLTISYQWASPDNIEVISRKITPAYAIKINTLLSLNEELKSEIKEFIGYVSKIDAGLNKNDWRILNIEDDKEYTGKSSKLKLDGIIINTVKYRFICEEIIEEFRVIEKEKTKYNLLNFEEMK
jgi:hypothetical protein